jgi:hypothetical protein
MFGVPNGSDNHAGGSLPISSIRTKRRRAKLEDSDPHGEILVNIEAKSIARVVSHRRVVLFET